jgi:hypothetical protein
VVETDHQLGQTGAEYHPLDIAEGLPERVRPEIPLQVKRGALTCPGLLYQI